MLFPLDICVNKKAPPTHSVNWGLHPATHPKLENTTPFFLSFQARLKYANYPSPPFWMIHPFPRPQNRFFMHPPPSKKKSDF